ncbi:MAG: sugar kinase [Acholeplasmataceae bacterium]|nr:sugar kinase [Acholeplasmataceae bacterium]
MAKIITLGEIMLRLSTPGFERFTQASTFRVHYGGGEANVAASLAGFGHHAIFLSSLPDHEIGTAALKTLREAGIDTSFVDRSGERLGLYYLETGASMRPSTVIYDRARSAISEAPVDAFDFDLIFKDADWFHWSGITPALSRSAAHLVKVACEKAKAHGVTISVDLNYRTKLWTPDQAKAVMTPLMSYVDVMIGNEEDAERVLGFKPPKTDVLQGQLDLDGYKTMFQALKETFGFSYVASSLRTSYSATHNGWKALLYDGNHFYESKTYDINPIIDRVGAGDAFASGLIHGLITATPAFAIEFGAAAGALKHTIPGDFNQVSVKDVLSLVEGNQSGRVQR